MPARQFNLFFFILFLVHLAAVHSGIRWLEISTKPLIVALLMTYFYLNKGLKDRFSGKIFAALIWSWIGDVVLMLVPFSASFFLIGLGAFLVAQLAYASAFFEDVKKATHRPVWLIPFAIAFFGTYSYLLYSLLAPGLGPLKMPVLFYAIVISVMAVLAWSRWGNVRGTSYWLVAAGALLFVTSDTVLAINKFKLPFPHAGLIIMATYMLAQYGITLGAVKRKAPAGQ